ncbi:MAG: UpxY family transcription antiterminator, partial [Muribaculaceae bacterium]
MSAEDLDIGVSTNYTRLVTESGQKEKDLQPKEHWYALRVTYGREKKAYDYLVDKNVEAYYPTIITTKIVNGKRKTIEESRLPNMFFARGTEEVIKSYVYDNINLPYLRFYYRHYHEGRQILKEPLIVPDNQIKSLKIICASEAEDILFVPVDVQKFKAGQSVRIIDGIF